MKPKRNTAAPALRIEITPTPSQYCELCRDLETLRGRGAHSNTEAILQAVRAAALDDRIPTPKSNGKGARERPNPRNRKVSS